MSAHADNDPAPRDRLIALGAKAAVIPPVFVVGEVIVRPIEHLAFGVYGMATGRTGFHEAPQVSVGGELTYEFNRGRINTPYFTGSYGYYHASPDPNGNFETSETIYALGGYIWKWRFVESYVGGGFLVILSDVTRPCSAFCVDNATPVLPTVDIGLRVAFL
jgi:hypothetical protein